jgi:hypothetical protein
MSWHHVDSTLSNPPGAGLFGNCTLIGSFYDGSGYQTAYQGALFFCDFGQRMKVATFDAIDQLVAISDFATNMEAGRLCHAPADQRPALCVDPDGAGAPNSLHRPVTDDPVAVATGTPLVGQSPAEITFDGSESFSPVSRPLTFFWNFGDGQGSSSPSPIHIYQDAGVYDAVLTVTDDIAAVGRDTIRIVAYELPDFPTSEVLDDFNRANGPIGSQWVDDLFGLVIADSQLTQTAGLALPVWNGSVFGPEQEAFVTLNAITATSPHHTLMLKVQGTSFSTGHIQVRYDANFPRITVATFLPSSVGDPSESTGS